MTEIKHYQLDWENETIYHTHLHTKEGCMIFYCKMVKDDLEISCTRMPNNTATPDDFEDLYIEILEHFDTIAENLSARYIKMGKGCSKIFKKDQSNQLLTFDYLPFSHEESVIMDYLGENFHVNGWFKDMSGKVQYIKQIKQTTYDTLKNEIGIYMTSTRFIFKKHLIKNSFYFQEKEYLLNIIYDNHSFILSYNDFEYPFEDLKELENGLHIIIEKIQKNHRLELLYNPPRKHFDHYMRISTSLSKETIDAIHSSLQNTYSPEEIEKKAEKFEMNFSIIEFQPSYWMKCLNHIFILDDDKKFLSYFKDDEVDQAKEFTLQHIEESIKEQARQKILDEQKKMRDRFQQTSI